MKTLLAMIAAGFLASFAQADAIEYKQLVLKSTDLTHVFVNYKKETFVSGSNGGCVQATLQSAIVVGKNAQDLKSFLFFEGEGARAESTQCDGSICRIEFENYVKTISCSGPGYPGGFKAPMPRVSFEVNGQKLVDSIPGGTVSFGLNF